jgi:hypothetical protein
VLQARLAEFPLHSKSDRIGASPRNVAMCHEQTSTILAVAGFTRLEGNDHFACPEQAAEAIAGRKANLDVFRTRIKG